MDQQLTTEGEIDMPRHRASADQGGFVLPWFALLLLVMIAMAGFGVDVWNWWYTAQKTQRAADAGALAGVVFMPGDPTSANSTALFAVSNNGYPSSAAAVGVPAGGKPNQLQVTVSQTVSNSFTSLLGVATTKISRSATAEFNEPVKMGSPQAHIANDPEHPPVDQHWLNIGAPGVDKHTGDRYADYQCLSSYLCDGSNKNSQEYLGTSYVFTVEVPAGSPDIDIQAYDPEYANGGTTCDQNWGALTAGNIDALQAAYPSQFGPDADQRYATGASMWCTGDDSTNLGTPQATAWLVRGPTKLGNPFQPLTNDVLPSIDISGASGPGSSNSCTKQFEGYNRDFYSLLNPGSATYQPDFYASFHRWYTLCHISGAAPGRYFVQVRSAVPLQPTPSIANLTKSEDPTPENQALAGQNRYSLRVVNHLTNTYTPNVNVYAEAHLPIYSNVLNNANQTPLFYLARLLPGGGASGRVLQLRFYDIGDVGGGTTTITVTPPSEMTGKKPVCTWTANGGRAFPTEGTRNGCSVSGITQSDYPAGYNGTLIEANIQVFGDYNCANGDPAGNPLGCWFKIQMSYTDGTQANDTTTWDANIGGDPVRLIK
jgi:hypothetical protein